MPIYKTDQKKDGKQQYRVRINYVDQSGKPRQLTRVAYGATEAKDLERQLSEEIKKTSPAARKTMKSLYDEYIEACKSELRESTWDKKRRMFESTILPLVGDIKLDKFSVAAAQKFKTGIVSRDISRATAGNYCKELSAMLNFAVRMEYIPRNPMKKIGGIKSAELEAPEKKVRYYTAEEFKEYIAAAKAAADERGNLIDHAYYIFFMVAFYTGMRKGEINALKWSDIDGNVIHVRRSITQKLRGEDRETPPKNQSSIRDIQIPTPLMNALKEHRSRQESESGFTTDWRVCGGQSCLRDTSIEKRNESFAKAAGLPHRTIHEFRHSHASLLANNGINIQEIARRLGHSQVEITWNTYSHLYPKEEERAIEILNKIV